VLGSPKASGTGKVTILTDATMGDQQETGGLPPPVWAKTLEYYQMDFHTRLGSLAEAKVIAKLIESGFDTFIQFSGKARFDTGRYHKDPQRPYARHLRW